MDPNIPRADSWQGRPDTYWRRRAIVFAGVLGVLALLAWACSATGGGPGSPRQAGGHSDPATGTPATGTPATGTTATETTAAAQQTASSAAPTSVPEAADRARSGRARKGSARKGRAPSGPRKHAGRASTSVRQRVRSRRRGHQPAREPRTYRQSTEPGFTIYLVNAGRRTCAFDADPRSLRLVIESGRVHQWSPADCTHDATSAPRPPAARRAIRYARLWNRERSRPGCSSPRTRALRGTYTATVTAGAVHSRESRSCSVSRFGLPRPPAH